VIGLIRRRAAPYCRDQEPTVRAASSRIYIRGGHRRAIRWPDRRAGRLQTSSRTAGCGEKKTPGWPAAAAGRRCSCRGPEQHSDSTLWGARRWTSQPYTQGPGGLRDLVPEDPGAVFPIEWAAAGTGGTAGGNCRRPPRGEGARHATGHRDAELPWAGESPGAAQNNARTLACGRNSVGPRAAA
jgi:hypothetical protein